MGRRHRGRDDGKQGTTNSNAAAPALALVDSSSSGLTTAALVLLIVLFTCIAYGNTLSVPWHFDDEHVIQTNPRIRDFGASLSRIGTAPRSLVDATFAINYAIGGLNTRGYHIVNLAIHATAALCLYGWISTVLRNDRRHIAFFSAALFAVHPLATQSVTYVAQRYSSMAGLFFFAALWMWALFRQRNRWHWYIASLLAAIAGMLCKEMAIAIPLAIVLCDVALHCRDTRPDSPARWNWLALLPVLATLPIVPILDAMGRAPNPESESAALTWAGGTNITRAIYFFSQWRILVYSYLRLMFYPVGLSIDPPFEPVTGPTDAKTLLAGLALCGMLFLGLYFALRARSIESRLAGVGLLLFFLGLGATSTIIPNSELMQEQRAYVSLAGIMLVVAIVVLSTFTWPWVARAALLSLFILVSLGATHRRNQQWQTYQTLWQSAVDLWDASGIRQQKAARSYTTLGVHLGKAGNLKEAERRHRQALEFDPGYPLAHNNLGNLLVRRRDYAEAIRHFDKAIESKPDYAPAYNNKGIALAEQGRVAEALPLFLRAVEIDPGYADAHGNLANAYADAGRRDDAIRHYRIALDLFHASPEEVHHNLGATYFDMGRVDDAVAEFREAVRLRPSYANAHYSLALALSRKGLSEDAIAALQTVLRLTPGDKSAQAMLDRESARMRRSTGITGPR